MFRDKITKHLRENGIRIQRVVVRGDTVLDCFLSKADVEKIKRNRFTYQVELDATLSFACDRDDCVIRFVKAHFKYARDQI